MIVCFPTRRLNFLLIIAVHLEFCVDHGTMGELRLPCPGFGNSSGVAQHAYSTRNLGQVTTRNNSWRLVVDSNLNERIMCSMSVICRILELLSKYLANLNQQPGSKCLYLKSGWAPINKLNGPFCLNGCNGSIDILWYNIASVQHTTCHVLS